MRTTTHLLTLTLAAICAACGGPETNLEADLEADVALSEAALTTGLRVVRTDYDRRAGAVLVEVLTDRGVLEGAGVSPFLRASVEYMSQWGYGLVQSETRLEDAQITDLGRAGVSIIIWVDGPPPTTSGFRSSVELVGAAPTPHP